MTFLLEPQKTEVGYPSLLAMPANEVLVVFYVGGTSIQGAVYAFD